jgi:hypothetical protein
MAARIFGKAAYILGARSPPAIAEKKMAGATLRPVGISTNNRPHVEEHRAAMRLEAGGAPSFETPAARASSG